MIDLPAIAVSAAAGADPSKLARTADTGNEIKRDEKANGVFQQALAREIGALLGSTSAAIDAGDGAGGADRSKGSDSRDQTLEAIGTVDTSRALTLPGAIALPAALATGAARDSAAPSERGRRNDGPDASQVPASTVDASVAALPTGAISVHPAFAVAKPVPAAIETARADVPVATSALLSAPVFAPASVAADVPSAGNVRAGNRWPGQAGADPNRSASMPAPADTNPIGPERAAERSRVEFNLGASSIPAESAAAGRFLPPAPAALEPETALEAPQRAESPLPSGMNMGVTGPIQVAHAATLATQLAAPEWDRALGEKVLWMAGRQMQVAELNLNPPELGPLQITLTVNSDQASAQFVSQHAAVREAIETAMPRLREMLAEGGITLGNASVSADSFGAEAHAQQDARQRMPPGAAQADTGGAFRVTQLQRATRGLVDIFA